MIAAEGSPVPARGTPGLGLGTQAHVQAPMMGRPWLGLLAVLLGAFISTLTGRLSTFGLADIRGAMHAGFDEGAWITTAQTTAQMLIAPFAVWAGSAYGARRVLMTACMVFAAVSLILPLSPNLPVLLGLQFTGGLASGCFLPLTIAFILRSLSPRYWAYGVVIYALNLELSLNISASLEGWYVDHLSWHWIFWQNAPLALAMAVCIYFGIVREPPNPLSRRIDSFGFATAGVGLALIYAALDQGNRLDWLNSGLICGLLLAGGFLVAVFVIHEASTPYPWLNLRGIVSGPLPIIMLMVSILRLTVLSTAFLIPQYLGAVRGFRALEVGQALIWIAVPQLITCPIAAFMLRRSDPRIAAGVGLTLVGVACFMIAHGLTAVWGPAQFLTSQLLQALGQSLALSGVIFSAVLRIRPADALTFGAMLQTARLMGGEVGLAFVTTFVRVREQRASNIIGTHVRSGASDALERLRGYTAILSHAGDPATSASRAAALLGGTVRTAATLQGVIDTYVAVGTIGLTGLVLLCILHPAPPGPASHVPFRIRPLTLGFRRSAP